MNAIDTLGVERRARGEAARSLVVVAAFAGAAQALRAFVAGLPTDLPAALVVLQQRSRDLAQPIGHLLARATRLRTQQVIARQPAEPGVIYVAPPDLHVTMSAQRTFELVDPRRLAHASSPTTALLVSAAAVYRNHTIAVVLTGRGNDATEGARAVAAAGGVVFAQDPTTAFAPDMPASAIASGAVAHVMRVADMAPAIEALARAAER